MLLIDGKAISEQIKSELKAKVEAYKQRTGKVAGLSVIIIGENPASQVYVRNKAKSCVEIGMRSEVIELRKPSCFDALTRSITIPKFTAFWFNSRFPSRLMTSPLRSRLNLKKMSTAFTLKMWANCALVV